MAIGNYWECVLPEDADTPPLERIVGQSTKLAQRRFSSWRFQLDGQDLGGAEFVCLGFAAGEIRAIVHLVKPRGRPDFYLHSAFPWLAAGTPAKLRLYDVDTDHFGLEGFIEAGIPVGPKLKFFDPLFALNKDKYKIDGEHRFSLAAVSLDLDLAGRTATARKSFRLDGMEVDISRAKILVPVAEDAPDYYVFQGSVRDVRTTAFLDRPFLAIRTAVIDLDGGDLAVDIYVDRARLRSRSVPTRGDMVAGTLWLQGCLFDPT